MDQGMVVEEAREKKLSEEVAAPVTPVRHREDSRPDPQWVRGRCPECGDDLVSNLYYIGGKGYLLCWECWGSLSENPTCRYRKVL